MRKESFYNVVSNKTNIASFVGSMNMRLLFRARSQSPNVYILTRNSPELAHYFFEEGANKGIKDHLRLIYFSSGSPNYSHTLSHLNNTSLMGENIFKAITEPTVFGEPSEKIDLDTVVLGLVEISELSETIAKKHASYVEKHYSERILNGILY